MKTKNLLHINIQQVKKKKKEKYIQEKVDNNAKKVLSQTRELGYFVMN